MSKTQKIIISVLAVLTCIAVVFTALTFSNSFSLKLKRGGSKAEKSSVEAITELSFESQMPLLQTCEKNVFYSVYPDGTVKYYKYEDGAVTEVTAGVETHTVKLSCSSQKVVIKLYCLKTEGGLNGYGVFTSDQKSETMMIPYVFARLMPCPAAYGSVAGSKYVVLLDFEAKDVYKADKTYSDMFSADLSSGKTSLIFSQRDRAVAKDGLYNQAWSVYTESAMRSSDKNDLFASGRYHDMEADVPLWDLLSVENTESVRKAEAVTTVDCVSPYVYKSGKDYTCLVKSEKGFDLVKNGKKDDVIKSFVCSISDCSVSGGYILNLTDGSITSMADGTEFFTGSVPQGRLSAFGVSENAAFAVILYKDKEDTLYVYNAKSDSASVISGDKLVNTVGNLCFISDSLAMLSQYDSGSKVYNNIIINLGG